jgi:hypothetical protein
MSTTDILLLATILLLGYLIIRIEAHHRRLIRLLSDLATMIGDGLDELTGR